MSSYIYVKAEIGFLINILCKTSSTDVYRTRRWRCLISQSFMSYIEIEMFNDVENYISITWFSLLSSLHRLSCYRFFYVFYDLLICFRARFCDYSNAHRQHVHFYCFLTLISHPIQSHVSFISSDKETKFFFYFANCIFITTKRAFFHSLLMKLNEAP